MEAQEKKGMLKRYSEAFSKKIKSAASKVKSLSVKTYNKLFAGLLSKNENQEAKNPNKLLKFVFGIFKAIALVATLVVKTVATVLRVVVSILAAVVVAVVIFAALVVMAIVYTAYKILFGIFLAFCTPHDLIVGGCKDNWKLYLQSWKIRNYSALKLQEVAHREVMRDSAKETWKSATEETDVVVEEYVQFVETKQPSGKGRPTPKQKKTRPTRMPRFAGSEA